MGGNIKKNINLNDYLNNTVVFMKDLFIEQCYSSNRRKIIKPLRDKITIRSVEFYYNTNVIFRDVNNKKKYYTADEVKNLINKK